MQSKLIEIQRMLAHPPQTAKYNNLVFECLEWLLENGHEPCFDRYGMKLSGDYVDGSDIKDQILTATFKLLDEA